MPRFSGKQYPGAMRDHRARLRTEAFARQSRSDKQKEQALRSVSDIFADFARIFQPLADAFRALGASVFVPRKQTQDDYALVPPYDGGGGLRPGLSVIENRTGKPIYFVPPQQGSQ